MLNCTESPDPSTIAKPSSAGAPVLDFLLIGGGLCSATAAEALRRQGTSGSIGILSNEPIPPYHSPRLSKQYLLGGPHDGNILVHPASFYGEHGIELLLNVEVAAVDIDRRAVRTSDGRLYGYRKLLIATGATPKPCEAPGHMLPGIHVLRTKADSDDIRRAASRSKRAVVFGGSFLGMEIAMSLRDLGLEVTVIEYGGRLLTHLESAVLSEFFMRHARERGIAVLMNDTVSAFRGRDRVEEIETASGLRKSCDFVVVSIGVAPATAFLQGSGIHLENGRVTVDALLQTNDPNVFAAGDVACFYDPVFGRRRHIEHWDNAVKQGRLAAKNMLGHRLRYDEVSYFFCEIGDIEFNVLGATEESNEWISRGDLDQRSFALFYLKDDVLRAEFSLGRPASETRRVEAIIRYRVNMRDIKGKLADLQATFDQIPTQTVLILQGGGALGAFECGVVKALESEKIFPDIVAGVSIGAVNGAIVASNPRNAAAALEAFWAELMTPISGLSFLGAQHMAAANVLAFGVPNFFRPRWLPPFDWLSDAPWNWTSYYDPSPLKDLIVRYVDFESLRTSSVRLLIAAVNVTTGELEVFDSYVDQLTPDHILASGSLPPGFPWTVINGKAYWDGGIVSNSPLDIVVERCGPDGKRVFIVDLFSGERSLPTNMVEIIARRDEIIYSERVRSDLRVREINDAYRRLTHDIMDHVDPAMVRKIRHWPGYVQLMGDGSPINITRFIRQGRANEPSSRDYDFSDVAIRFNQCEGYTIAKRALAQADANITESTRCQTKGVDASVER